MPQGHSHNYHIYIMTNGKRTLYTGVTNNLLRRVYEHKNKQTDGFTKRYNITYLVHFEETTNVQAVGPGKADQRMAAKQEGGTNRAFKSKLE